MIDLEKNTREHIRWLCILTLDHARPIGANESLILSTIQSIPMQCTALELRKELDYLSGCGFVEITQKQAIQWHIKLTSKGVDLAQYVTECPAGIARPPKYWG